ncbi:T-cell immunomodulatory protein [Engraulis encrasicolus]|uniref:T-cell immunomodulatory protein n=1 Tax=Engraulis encrasicolus TaxID=184585 RepID=UPI002FD54592
MWLYFTYILAIILGVLGSNVTFARQDVTADLFGSEKYGTIAAFGDFNSDKQTDIFIIREQSELVIFLADLKAPYFKPKVRLGKDDIPSGMAITSVVPGDYDGDSQMDILLTTVSKATPETKAFVFWGNNQTLDKAARVDLNKTFHDEPLVMDFNGDMIPDIFGVVEGTTKVCYLTNRQVVWQDVLDGNVKMRVPHSNAFIDLNKDFTADLFLTIDESGFETWINKDGNFNRTSVRSLKAPDSAKKLGQSSFVDFDGDGFQDHLLPACEDDQCTKSFIYLSQPGETEPKWVKVLTDLQWKGTVWGFVPPVASSSPGEMSIPITLHLGDYNLDGFPDALAIFKNTTGSEQQAFLLDNVPCDRPDCQDVGRMFRPHWEQPDLKAIPQARLATFFDIYEDGILDMLVLSKEAEKDDLTIHALKNNFEADAYFVKVIVLSGLSNNEREGQAKVKPFGVNQPGPYVMYTSVDSNGYLKNASAGQLSQSAHLSLQLPYTVLGLGRSANFLDHLFVGIPRPPTKAIRKQEWTAIIPNSQLIVIPYPLDDPRSWSAKLYLTPSNIVLLTAIALIGVCVFILVIIGVLHWQEKKADDREKRQEAHRFHFDAM